MNITLKYVAYYRVSTARQGRSGLGLGAQQNAVNALIARNGGLLIAEFTEVETGKSASRPKLAEAIKHARLTNSILVVAKLDRLARNAAFTRALKESGLKFVCCDNEHANPLTIDILATIAEHEALAIAQRTKAALAVARERGTPLGSHRPNHWLGREGRRQAGLAVAQPVGCQANAQAARDFYCDYLVPEFKRRRAEGQTIPQIVAWLNDNHFLTRRQKPFTNMAVSRILERYA